MSAIVIPFVSRPRDRNPDHAPLPLRPPVRPDDLVMDHVDSAPCEYLPRCGADAVDPNPPDVAPERRI